MELIQVLRRYNASGIRHLAFTSAHRLDGKDTEMLIKNLPDWFRYSRWDFPETWEFVDKHTILLKSPPMDFCNRAQWDAIAPITNRATASLMVYFYLWHLVESHGYGCLVAKSDISDTLGVSPTSVRKGINALRKANLLDGYFPNGWPMQIICLAGDSNFHHRYQIRRQLSLRIKSPNGKIFGIPYGGQKRFSQRMGINENTLSKICQGSKIQGWQLVPYS